MPAMALTCGTRTFKLSASLNASMTIDSCGCRDVLVFSSKFSLSMGFNVLKKSLSFLRDFQENEP